MDTIKQWAMVACITLVGTSLFSLMIPKGNMQKIIKFTISMFFISSIVSPFITGAPVFDFNIISGEVAAADTQVQLDETADEQFKAIAAGKIKELIMSALVAENIEIKKIDINVNIDETNSIDISDIQITLDKSFENRKSEIQSLVTKEVGFEAIINFE